MGGGDAAGGPGGANTPPDDRQTRTRTVRVQIEGGTRTFSVRKTVFKRKWKFPPGSFPFLLETVTMFFLQKKLDLSRFYDFSGRDLIFLAKTTFFLQKKRDRHEV